MAELSSDFTKKIKDAWGNPEKVADIGFDETFNHENVLGLDYDDEVRNAKRVGMLAGLTADKGPDAFIEGYTAFLNE